MCHCRTPGLITTWKNGKLKALAVANPERIENMGGVIVNAGPEKFRDYVAAETAQWKEAVEISGARVD